MTSRFPFLLLIPLLLCQCSTIPPDQASRIKRVVVANYVDTDVTRYEIGFTAFGNEALEEVAVPELRQRMQEVLESELEGRFQEVIYDRTGQTATVRPGAFAPKTNFTEIAKELGAKHQADAVLILAESTYFPYGAPSYMTADGFGVWHSSSTAWVACYVTPGFLDAKTGESIADAIGVYEPRHKDVPFKKSFAEYTQAERAHLVDLLSEAFRGKLQRYFKSIGFPSGT